jgi:hypothetical protein
MDYRKMYSDYVREQIAENANPYPTGVQGFRGGVEAERARIIALLENHLYSGAMWSLPYQSGVGDAIALIKGENE